MSSDETPEDPRFNPFLPPGGSLELGRVIDLRQVFDGYLKPALQAKQRERKTISAIDRHLRVFDEWWEEERKFWEARGQTTIPRPIVASVNGHLLGLFQQRLLENGRTPSYVNKALGSIVHVLKHAEAKGLITHVPRVQSLTASNCGPLIYLSDKQLNALWDTAPRLAWPRKRRDFTKLHYDPGTAWRCCLILWVTYGFRTQDLVAHEHIKTPITWGSVHYVEETPNPVGHVRNDLGWLVYVPSKERKVAGKDVPLYLPLNRHARAALDHLRPTDYTDDMPICDWTCSTSSFYKAWHEWTRLAEVESKTGDRIQAKHLRNTCATRSEIHRAGVSAYITGHAADRSGTQSLLPKSKVAQRHYQNPEKAILECISTISLPSHFDEILRWPGR